MKRNENNKNCFFYGSFADRACRLQPVSYTHLTLPTIDKTEHSVSTPQPDIPKESETPAPPETEEAPSETDFDINYWISFAKGYAQSVGLLLDSEAVYCWDNPIRAGAHCKYLERDIHSRLDRYKADEEITAVWIWAEEVSDGIYDIYIGYA